jgi:transposase-like protein
LIAVGIDGENHVLPLAWAIVPKENEYWWVWFIRLFRTAFDSKVDLNHAVIISNKAKGLLNAVVQELPELAYSMCCQHLAENVHKEFSKKARQLFWPITRSKTT